ncbi:hypothetical protein FNH09_02365 [Streptomyces adustus]|uniref:Outer membrane channel protein CpnT-like N-terminal domain-containing protein n=1 Tax=Streptomyces adustus TaxID=1609272 RepID=A0A5N8V805_9ACTN|nr:hypothetical protein [Streptomyces adustus]MPY30194.1 hypothetical protein [Streptomyces adustus]
MIAALVGDNWPTARADRLEDLSRRWEEMGRLASAVQQEITAAHAALRSGVGGDVADAFTGFLDELGAAFGAVVDYTGEMSRSTFKSGQDIAYTKAMMLLQAFVVLLQVLQWMIWAPEAIPALLTAGRYGILKAAGQLAVQAGIAAVIGAGMSLAVQIFQIMSGERKGIDWDAVGAAAKDGALGGAVVGLSFGLAGLLPKSFRANIFTKIVVAAAGGVAGAALTWKVDGGGPINWGLSFVAGAAGGIDGGRHARKALGSDIKAPHLLNSPDALTAVADMVQHTTDWATLGGQATSTGTGTGTGKSSSAGRGTGADQAGSAGRGRGGGHRQQG